MFETLLTQPLYNGFIYLVGVVPGGDVGFAIIALTCIVRFLFYPVFAAQIRSTMGMQAMQGELEEVRTKFKDNREEQVKKMQELYKKYNVNPFAFILSIFIQLPIFFALYYAFFHTALPKVNTELLYPFVPAPGAVDIHFLGILNLTTAHDIPLAILVALLQYFVMYFTLGRTNKHAAKHLSPEKLEAQKMQQNMMLYLMPAIIASISYSLPSAVGVYFAAGSVVSLGQEWLIRHELKKKPL